jgi:hypothetical protein
MYNWQRRYCKDPVMQDIVLIGGDFDKEVISVDNSKSTYVRMQIMNPREDQNSSEVYRVEQLLGRYRYFKVGIYEELSIDEALELLIENYKEV